MPPGIEELAGPGSAPAISPVPGFVVPGTSADAISCCWVLFWSVGEVDVAGVSLLTGGVVSAPVVGLVVIPLPLWVFSLAAGAVEAVPLVVELDVAAPAVPAVVEVPVSDWFAAFSPAADPVIAALGLEQCSEICFMLVTLNVFEAFALVPPELDALADALDPLGCPVMAIS